MSNFFEVKDIRKYILESNSWEEFQGSLFGKESKTKGDAFELLCMCFLKTDSFYGSIFKNVFHQSELSFDIKVKKLKLAKGDIGVDLIGEDFEGGYWAIQCKYRSLPEKNLILNNRLAEFFSMTGGQSLKKELANRILISTTNDISRNIKDNYKEFSQILNPFFTKLKKEDFSRFKEFLNHRYKYLKIKKKIKKLGYQENAISDVVNSFKTTINKGQLLMACGSGKTLTALQIKEKMKMKKVLYLLPSLNLINQTLREWVSYSTIYFKPLCVCSDPTSSNIIDKKDRWLFSKEDIGIPVLNSSLQITQYLKGEKDFVIFCTYKSADLIFKAQEKEYLPKFDITFCDEAHNCAGNGFKKSGLILDEKKIQSQKRLFMTATPLNLDQKIKDKAFEKNIEVSSMDDLKKFGSVFHTLSFREAVKNEILVPYRIIFQEIMQSESEVIEKILKRKLVKIPDIEYIDSESIACDIALIKAMKKYSFNKVITFHRLVKFAKYFSNTLKYIWQWMNDKEKSKYCPECYWLSGESHSQQERQTILEKFKNIPEDKSLIVSNAQCLSEGVNVPSLDGVCFVDPKRSENDIIQSVGRVMRTSPGKEAGYIVIPIFFNDKKNLDKEFNESRYKYIWRIIKVLMLHDDYLSETIKKLRIELGERKKSTRDPKGLELPKEIIISEELKETFADAIDIVLIKELTDDWFERFGELKSFYEKEGHSSPTRRVKILGSWCDKQRQRYRNETLSKEKINLLNEINFIWTPQEDKWNDNYKELKEFYLREGHSNPLKSDNFKLYTWIMNLRNREIDNERRDLLDKIEFEWEPETLLDKRWIEKYEELKEFYLREGHSTPPENFVSIYRWSIKQRGRYRDKKMPKKRILLLDKIKFEWNLIEKQWDDSYQELKELYLKEGHSSPPSNYLSNSKWHTTQRRLFREKKLSEKQIDLLDQIEFVWDPFEKQWNDAYQELKEFFLKEGHSSPPKDYQLSNPTWIRRQKKAFKNKKLSKEKIALLDKLNFEWSLPSEHQWEKGYQKLKEFFLKEGHSSPPQQFHFIGKWVSSQRVAFSKNKLTKSQIALLDEIKFVWNSRELKWFEGYNQLKDFYLKEGHSSPSKTKYPKIYNWISGQKRTRRKKTLSKDKIELLNQIEFQW